MSLIVSGPGIALGTSLRNSLWRLSLVEVLFNPANSRCSRKHATPNYEDYALPISIYHHTKMGETQLLNTKSQHV